MERKTETLNRGLTMVEVLVAVAVIAVIASIGWPTINQFRDRSRALSCASNLRGLGVALNLYLTDNQMRMPALLPGRRSLEEPGPAIDTALAPYVTSTDLFRCPGDDEDLCGTTGTSYFWNHLLNNQPTASLRFLLTTDHTRIPVLSDKENFHRGIGDEVNILYADGHVEKEVQFFVDALR